MDSVFQILERWLACLALQVSVQAVQAQGWSLERDREVCRNWRWTQGLRAD